MSTGFTPPTSSGEAAITLDLSSSSAEPRDRERSPVRVLATVARASSAGARLYDDDISVSSYSPHTRRRSRGQHTGATRERDVVLHTGATRRAANASPIPQMPTFRQSASHSNMQADQPQQVSAYQQNVLHLQQQQNNLLHQQQNNLMIGVDPAAVAQLAAEAAGAVTAARAESQAIATDAVTTVQAQAQAIAHEASQAVSAAQAKTQAIATEAASAVQNAEARAHAAAQEAAQAVHHAQSQASSASAQTASLQARAEQADQHVVNVLQRVNE